jgi:ATP-binding cassette subfamily C protein CydC
VAAVQAFNYLLPSAAIRGLAITRTATRYGERLLGHKAALLTLAGLRSRLFARLAAARPAEALETSTGDLAARLGNDVDALEDSVIRRATLPAALASATVALVAALAMGGRPRWRWCWAWWRCGSPPGAWPRACWQNRSPPARKRSRG